MSSLLTKLKQLILKDVLPLKGGEAEEVFRTKRFAEWDPASYQDLVASTWEWVENIWPALSDNYSSILFSPWELLRLMRSMDSMANTAYLPATLQNWNHFNRLLYQGFGDHLPAMQMIWYHQELELANSVSAELKLHMGTSFESLDFDAESDTGRVNRWLYRSTRELTIAPVEGLSGWCWANSRMRMPAELSRDYRLRDIPEAVFYPNPGRKIVCPMIQIIGEANWLENDKGEGVSFTLQEKTLDCVIWKSKTKGQVPDRWWQDLTHFSEKLSVDVRCPRKWPTITHRFRRPLKSQECASWFDPDQGQLSSVFGQKKVWLEEMLMVAGIELGAHARPIRDIPPPQKKLVIDQPFGLLIRERKSGLPLLLGWIEQPLA